jgi:hypothetical protein
VCGTCPADTAKLLQTKTTWVVSKRCCGQFFLRNNHYKEGFHPHPALRRPDCALYGSSYVTGARKRCPKPEAGHDLRPFRCLVEEHGRVPGQLGNAGIPILCCVEGRLEKPKSDGAISYHFSAPAFTKSSIKLRCHPPPPTPHKEKAPRPANKHTQTKRKCGWGQKARSTDEGNNTVYRTEKRGHGRLLPP